MLIAIPFVIALLFSVDLRAQVVEPSLNPTTDRIIAPVSAGNLVTSGQNIIVPSTLSAPTTATTTAVTTSATTTTVTTETAATTAATTTTTTTTPPTTSSTTSSAAAAFDARSSESDVKLTQVRFDPEPVTGLDEIPADNPPPSNGVPPQNLPASHPNAALLQSIRERTEMTPRWPMYNRTQGRQLKTYGPAFSSILISHKLKVVYIPVFKVATTSMMWNIAYLESNPHIMAAFEKLDTGDLMKVLHDMSSPAWENHTVFEFMAPQINEIFDDPSYLKFGFVRNPYDRIVSAYVDKVMRPPVDSEEYQDQMYSLYGFDEKVRAYVNETRPTFRDFLSAVKGIMASPRVPTSDLRFEEAYETNLCRRDMHWRPQVELLHPDLIHLDFVGHFDKMVEHREVVTEWMQRHTDRRLPKSSTGRLHTTDPSHKKELFEALRQDDELRDLLLTIYKEDFERFHFSKEVPNIDFH